MMGFMDVDAIMIARLGFRMIYYCFPHVEEFEFGLTSRVTFWRFKGLSLAKVDLG